MKKNFYFLFFILIVLYSCSIINNKRSEKNYFEFAGNTKNVQIIEYELLNDTINLKKDNRKLGKKEVIYNDSSFLLISRETYTNNIIIFNNFEGTVKTINFDKSGFSSFLDFGFINNDSIFLIYNRVEDGGYHDSIIFLCNANGDIIKTFTLKDAPVLCRENEQTLSENIKIVMFPNWEETFNYKDNKLFLHFITNSEYLGDTLVKNAPLAGYIDTKENKFQLIDIKYPDIEFGKQFFHSTDKYFFSTFSHDGDILFAFKYTPTIIKYNWKTGKSTTVQIKSSIFDTIYPFSSEKELPKGFEFSLPYPKYFILQYDEFRKQYYRFVLLPNEYGRGKYMVIVADTSFNVIAEGFPFKDNQFEFNFTKDFFFYDNQCYKMKFRDGTNTELISTVKFMKTNKETINKPVTHYIKNFAEVDEDNYTAVFMLKNITCEYTTDFFLKLFETNEEKYENDNIYLFVITDKPFQMTEVLKKYNLSPIEHSNIFIDSTFEYGAYNDYEQHVLPRIIKVRDNKIVIDTIFTNEKEGVDVQEFIINSAKEQREIKNK